MDTCQIVGRSSSHFTRLVRIFALELAVPHGFKPVFDLTSLDAAAFASNPALKIPILLAPQSEAVHGAASDAALFGAENICRELTRRSSVQREKVVLRGDVSNWLVANGEELTLHAMASGVSLILGKQPDGSNTASPKVAQSLRNCLGFLEQQIDALRQALPRERQLSFVEVALFCLLEHLPFRDVLPVADWPHLLRFCDEFSKRPSAQATPYRFDKP